MKTKKTLDFEVNLIPFIDLLSTCICFLLLTAVWINVASMNVKQAVGGADTSAGQKKPTLWVMMNPAGDLRLDLKDSKASAQVAKLAVRAVSGKPNFPMLASTVQRVRQLEPRLTTALIQPTAQSVYEDIITMMDTFKKTGLTDLGVAPL